MSMTVTTITIYLRKMESKPQQFQFYTNNKIKQK